MRSLDLPDSDSTDSLGQALARALPATGVLVLYLEGELGAGKTSLARALLRELGVEGPVRSPTYTLVERYRLAQGECVHLDLYRIAEPDELEFLGLDDLTEARLWLVEWPGRGGSAIPEPSLTIQLEHRGSGRAAVLQPGDAVGAAWVQALPGGDGVGSSQGNAG